jgi:hypothetical protein
VNNLHPSNHHDEIVEWIDTLLREMGHQPPAPPVEGAEGG